MGHQSGKSSRTGTSDRRRESREPLTGEVAILHEDEQGREVVARAQLLDGSVNGVRFRAQQRLPLRSPVLFYHRKLGVGGRGTVRYCNWSSRGYDIGVEFCQATDWRGPCPREALQRLRAAVDPPEPVAIEREVSESK
jgi:hypothetical protein